MDEDIKREIERLCRQQVELEETLTLTGRAEDVFDLIDKVANSEYNSITPCLAIPLYLARN